MFETFPLETAELKKAVADNSGGIDWISTKVGAIVLSATEKLQPPTSGIIEGENIFLIFTMERPSPGDQLVFATCCFEIRSVRIFRSMTGKIIVYRCVC